MTQIIQPAVTPSGAPPAQPVLIRSPLLPVVHGLTTRQGGVSSGNSSFAGLNLDDRQDDPVLVAENRRRAAAALGYRLEQVARLEQVHGTDVLPARAGVQVGDALVTDDPDLLLVIGTADCYPVLLADPQAGVVGAAHAGWRGTVGRIAARTVEAMTRLGAQPGRIRAAIGTGICAECYPVGAEVADRFRAAGLGEFLRAASGGALHPDPLHPAPLHPDPPHLDLAAANRRVLLDAGLRPEHVWQAGGCSTAPQFYSYRRDAGQTGRMWAMIGARPAPAEAAGADPAVGGGA